MNGQYNHIIPENELDSKVDVVKNLLDIKKKMEEACKKAGRDKDSVKLIAVSKIKPVSLLFKAYGAGQLDFGENKPQELRDKQELFKELSADNPLLYSDVKWHMIGVLQKNKVKYVVGNTELIHSVDSVELAEEIEKEAAKKDVVANILMEINVGCEFSKSGFEFKDVENAIKIISKLPHVRIKGLMCIAPISNDRGESNRVYFRRMKATADFISSLGIENVEMKELSMGLSADFKVAIEEGATMVRIGTDIFGPRNYSL